VGRVAEKDEVF